MAQQPFNGGAWMVVATSVLIVVVFFLTYKGMTIMRARKGRDIEKAKRDAELRPPDRRELG